MRSLLEAGLAVNEIFNIQKYKSVVSKYDDDFQLLENRIEDLTRPKSPNGKENIGAAKGNIAVDYSAQLVDIYARQDFIKKEITYFQERIERAERYRKQLDKCDEVEFIIDYFDNKLNRDQMYEKYGYSNSFDHCRRIAYRYIKRL